MATSFDYVIHLLCSYFGRSNLKEEKTVGEKKRNKNPIKHLQDWIHPAHKNSIFMERKWNPVRNWGVKKQGRIIYRADFQETINSEVENWVAQVDDQVHLWWTQWPRKSSHRHLSSSSFFCLTSASHSHTVNGVNPSSSSTHSVLLLDSFLIELPV